MTEKKKKRGRPPLLPRIRLAILLRDKGTCQKCGDTPKILSDLHVHHKIRRADGGTDEEDNLITLCKACHRWNHPTGKPNKPPIVEHGCILKTYRLPEETVAEIDRLQPAYGSRGKVIEAALASLDGKLPSRAAQDATRLRKQASRLAREPRELEVEYD